MRLIQFLFFFLFLNGAFKATGQTVFDWLNTAPDGNFRQGLAGDRWFDNVLLTNLMDEPTGSGIILRFNNNHQLITINNVPGTYSIYQLLFGNSNTNARTISGNAIRFANYLGVNPRIENQSAAIHVINTPIEGDGNPAYALELSPVAGNLTIGGTINNQGSPIHILGASGRNISLNGVVSGSGDLEVKQNVQYSPNAVNSYTGTTTFTSGISFANTSIVSSANGSFGNHASGLFLNGGRIYSNTATFSRPITIAGTNSYLDAYGSARVIASNITMPSGTMNLYLGGFFAVGLTGQDLTLSGAITNTSGNLSLTKISTSNLSLSGANTFSGSLTIQMGVVTINYASSLPAASSLVLSGGTFRVGSVAAASTLNAANLSMTASSVIDMGTATSAYTLLFANSSAPFTGTLTINNWSAANGKKIRFSNTTHIATVLSQINFTGYGTGAQIVNGDELWPAGLYVTQNSGSGNFSDVGSWLGGIVPPANSNIFVQSGFTLTIDGSYSLHSIDVAGILSCTTNHTLTIGSNYSKISNGGTINFTNGTLAITNSGAYVDGVNPMTLNNLTVSSPVSFLRATTINGILQLNAGAAVSGLAPTYGSSSSVIYNSGGILFRGVEWNSTTGAGFPKNIVLSNSTELRTDGSSGGNIGCSGDLTINAGSHLNFKNDFRELHITGNLTIHGTLSLSGGSSPDARVNLSGNWLRSATGSVDFNESLVTRWVYFNGNTDASITGPAGVTERIPFVIIQKAAASNNTITLNSPLRIISLLSLVSGFINSSAANPLILEDRISSSAGSVLSFVNGPVTKYGRSNTVSAPFTFPVGKRVGSEIHYRPLTVSARIFTDTFTCEFQRADPYTRGPISAAAKAAGLQRISRCEYWDLTRTPGTTTNVSVTLTWSSNAAGASRCNVGAYILNFTGIVAVQYNGTEWGDTFGGTPSGTNSDGQILWSGVSLYNKFVLGSNTTELNPLPFSFVSFEGRSRAKDIELHFSVTGNNEQKEYLLERSSDGIHFTRVEIAGAMVNLSNASYTSIDTKPFEGLNYYRLTSFDWQGKFEQSKTIQVWFGNRFLSKKPFIYPNPISGNQVHLYTSGMQKGTYSFRLLAVDGRLLVNTRLFIDGNLPSLSISLPAHLTKGVYWIILTDDRTEPLRFKILY